MVSPRRYVFTSPRRCKPNGLHAGEPYLIARIISLLPPLPSSSPSTSAPAPRAQVNYYFRPRDISNRYIADFRLIVATMHADIVPLAYVRGKCEVKHKEEIPDLESWKREKDCFYWHQVGEASSEGEEGADGFLCRATALRPLPSPLL